MGAAKKTGKRLAAFVVIFSVLVNSVAFVRVAKASDTKTEISIGVRSGDKLTARVGKKNLAKKTYTVRKDNVSIRIKKGSKKLSGLTYRSADKKVLTVSKKGVISIKRNGTAKVTIRAKYKKKTLTTWIKIKVKINRSSTDKPSASVKPQTTISQTGAPVSTVEPTTKPTAEAAVQPTAVPITQLTAEPTVQPPQSSDDNTDRPIVYMTRNITAEELLKVYQATSFEPVGKVAVKISTGEPPHSHYLDPNLIKDLVQSVDGTIVECNTAYGGSRASTVLHKQVAADHGFTAIADVDIMDEEGSISLPVTGGKRLSEDFVGSHFTEYGSFIVLSHFKGHAMAGFGGAIKNISIGIASSEGKAHIHSGGTGGSMWGGDQNAFLESMGEAGKAVSDSLDNGKNIVYVNVMNNLSVDCDCDGNPAEPEMADIGILASTDPVALDQACIDLVYEQKDGDGKALVNRIESKNGLLTLEHAEKIGLGSRGYELQMIDPN